MSMSTKPKPKDKGKGKGKGSAHILVDDFELVPADILDKRLRDNEIDKAIEEDDIDFMEELKKL